MGPYERGQSSLFVWFPTLSGRLTCRYHDDTIASCLGTPGPSRCTSRAEGAPLPIDGCYDIRRRLDGVLKLVTGNYSVMEANGIIDSAPAQNSSGHRGGHALNYYSILEL